MWYPFLRSIALLCAVTTLGCVHADDVQAAALAPRYARPSPPVRSAEPLVLLYDANELPEVVQLVVPNGFPAIRMLGARSLVTQHLRSGLETLFAQVSVTSDRSTVPPGALVGTVHFVDVGLALAPGGKTLVGTLEWSLTLAHAGAPEQLYSWSERTVGTREGAGSFGHLDPAPEIQGAIEASLRALLKDMDTKGVAAAAPPAAAEVVSEPR